MSALADQVHVDPAILGYVSQLADESRQLRHVRLGLSASAAAWPTSAPPRRGPLADGRGYVVPDDIKELAVPVLSHRLLLDAEAEFSGVTVDDVIGQLLSQVRPPTSRGA